MIWIVAAILAGFLWASTNILDQVLMRKYYVSNATMAMAIAGLVQIIPFTLICLYDFSLVQTTPFIALIFISTGIINSFSFILYLKALEKGEASNLVPIFQLQPVAIFIMAFFLFGETIEFIQIIGTAIIIISALSVSIDFENKKYNWNAVVMIAMCAFLLSVTTIIDRALLENQHWLTALSWKAMGYLSFSAMIFIIKPSILKQVVVRLKAPIQNGMPIFISTELIGFTATGLFLLSLKITPSAGLTQTLVGFMPFFVLGLGIIGHRFLPDYIKAPKTGKHMAFHLLCLATMLFGLYLIY